MFISVDLPAPFWPISPSTRPRPSASVTSRHGVDAEEGLADALEREDRSLMPRPRGEEPRAHHVERAAARMIAALHHVDVEGREAHVVERVGEQDEEQHADEGPDDLALAAGELVPPITVAPMMSSSAEPAPMVGRPPPSRAE